MPIPTPHIRAKEGDFAKTVLMPGDPLRAKYIAETYLENPVLVTDVRNMLGFTGTYKGKRVSVMGGGMGMPSIGIYSHELFNFYGVENIIRIGSAGSISESCPVRSVVIAQAACTNSSWAKQYEIPGTYAPIANYGLLSSAVELAHSAWIKMGVLCVEMEAAALYMEAARSKKNALAILTISDNIITGEELSSDERQTGFGKMMELALELA